MRLFLQAERELLRYVMVVVPNPADARDVVQETAVALWRAAEKYDQAKPFVPWACRFALNEARRFMRDESRRRRFLDDGVVAQLLQERSVLGPQLDARRDHLGDCLARLPGEQQAVVRGYYFEEQTIEGLAARLGLGPEALYKHLQRTRRLLHDCIERKMRAELSP